MPPYATAASPPPAAQTSADADVAAAYTEDVAKSFRRAMHLAKLKGEKIVIMQALLEMGKGRPDISISG